MRCKGPRFTVVLVMMLYMMSSNESMPLRKKTLPALPRKTSPARSTPLRKASKLKTQVAVKKRLGRRERMRKTRRVKEAKSRHPPPPPPIRRSSIIFNSPEDLEGKRVGDVMKEYLPTMEELREAFVACDEGKTLTEHQSWLIATFVSLEDMPTKYHRFITDEEYKNHQVSYEENRLILGCGDFVNCEFCHYRYNRTNWQKRPEEELPQNLTHYYDMAHDNLKMLLEKMKIMFENPTDEAPRAIETLGDFDFSKEIQPVKEAHVMRDPKVMNCSILQLKQHADSETHGTQHASCNVQAMSRLPMKESLSLGLKRFQIERVGLVHLRNLGRGFAVFNGTKIQVIEEITNGLIMNVTVISANPIMRYQFELSRLGVEEHIDKWVQRDKEDQEMRLEAWQAFQEWQRAELLELEEEEKKKERPKFKPGQWKQRYGMRCSCEDG
ncbi:hypothetical protein GUITHDRAFT_164768 [Guillardia theta CCMP2712]|uniref:Uncharacterized protein n=1 Tax=Guillardia theta (strain CCMP2712) TaxID=905079 RepID=L1IW46_GUITC|nr:hypothetical protein GUITHDRAFT_164768 [Guillardia theta CCMP2712]EKX40070.1 hypothetical protein GUITHDRAFT_164768 [Guillardia theta CCMP2712]|eukprot:XP_005827050.1 hypothetical protein GUITHDRAFT_164768 [Guillardia theta CCMP2712]